MSKGLEALNEIKLQVGKTCLDECEHIYNDSCICRNNLHHAYGKISKELQALEIIKTKRVDVDYFLAIVRKYDDKFMDWYNQKNTVFAYLTQEEYELLKEVLCE